MITIKIFIFNDFQVNTYLLYDETKESIIIDSACYSDFEEKKLAAFIEKEELKLIKQLNTHCHIDHILGNNFIAKKYNIGLEIHEGGNYFLKSAKDSGLSFGFIVDRIAKPVKFINDGDVIKFGNSELTVLYTPGHADGSICLLNKEQKFVIAGDVLFNSSIGRTDLPTGDYNTLINSIKTKLLTLDDDYIVYPGHGTDTTIGFERKNNPFL